MAAPPLEELRLHEQQQAPGASPQLHISGSAHILDQIKAPRRLQTLSIHENMLLSD
jgi:hypothetical protein